MSKSSCLNFLQLKKQFRTGFSRNISTCNSEVQFCIFAYQNLFGYVSDSVPQKTLIDFEQLHDLGASKQVTLEFQIFLKKKSLIYDRSSLVEVDGVIFTEIVIANGFFYLYMKIFSINKNLIHSLTQTVQVLKYKLRSRNICKKSLLSVSLKFLSF